MSRYSEMMASFATDEERDAYRARRRQDRKDWLARQTPEKQAEMRERNRIRSREWHYDPRNKERIRVAQKRATQRWVELHRDQYNATSREKYLRRKARRAWRDCVCIHPLVVYWTPVHFHASKDRSLATMELL